MLHVLYNVLPVYVKGGFIISTICLTLFYLLIFVIVCHVLSRHVCSNHVDGRNQLLVFLTYFPSSFPMCISLYIACSCAYRQGNRIQYFG